MVGGGALGGRDIIQSPEDVKTDSWGLAKEDREMGIEQNLNGVRM